MITIDTQKISDFLATHNLGSGLGTIEEPCSVAAINLALTGRLTDDIPECMSLTIGKWIIGVQDVMPDASRNSSDWKALLPLAAGTGRDPALEQRRAALLLDWMWGVVLPQLQPLANANGFGAQWRTMLTERTEAAAWAAAWAARAARAARAAQAAAWAAAYAAEAWAAAGAAAEAAAWAAEAALATWAAEAAAVARAAAAVAENDEFWTRADPVEMLKNLIDCA